MSRHSSVLFIGALLSGACGSASPVPATSVSVGAATAHDARLGLVRSDQQILAYVCGGASSYATHSRWFSGPAAPGARLVTLEKAGWSLSIDLETAAAWLASPEGSTIAFDDLQPGGEGTATGVFDTFDRGCRTGVIVSQESREGALAMQGTWCDSDGNFEQVERGVAGGQVMSQMAAGFEVEVDRPDGRAVLHVMPVVP